MKILEPKRVTIGEVEFAIYPFGAFDAAGISGDLGNFFGPLIAGVIPFLGDGEDENGDAVSSIFEKDAKEVVPLLTGAFSSLDGKKIKDILRKLLINSKNITCQYRDESGQVQQAILTEELANQIFIMNFDGMLELAIEVVKLNFLGFFEKVLARYGNRSESSEELTLLDTEDSTPEDLITLK